MARLDSLCHRLEELESGLGMVELADGTLFKPGSGLDLMLMHARLCRDLGRDAEISDFSPGDQELFEIMPNGHLTGLNGGKSRF